MTSSVRHAALGLAVLCALGASAGGASAQSGRLMARCAAESPAGDLDYCNTVAQAIEIAQPRIAIAASAGNPTIGASSTLGMRIGSVPRFAIAPRFTVVSLDLPAVETRNGDEIGALVPAAAIDASIGVYSGLALLPTVGGFGSLDLYGSLGRVFLPGDDGFDSGVASWALGAQVGIVRESFSTPGITVSLTRRSVGDIEFGDPELVDADAYFGLTDAGGWGLRGTIGKRFLLFSLTGGVGYDWYDSDVTVRYISDSPLTGSRDFTVADFATDRLTAFGNLAFTVVIVSLAAEVGWQQGSEAFSGPGATDLIEKGGWYGSLALRFAP